jgi:nicotinamide mononucleotide adenylyltransferase
MKQEQMRYKCAATWGRFALPHTGHCSLIEQCLAHADYVDIHLSAHDKNNSYELRELLLKVMLRNRGVDLRRVNFYQTSNVNEALKQSIANAPFNEVVFVLGSDQQDMLFSLSDIHDVNFVINRRENSSTNMRYFLDSYDFIEDARYLYEDCSYSTTLAYMLRAEERNNEKSSRSAKKTGGYPCKDAYIESATECTPSVV